MDLSIGDSIKYKFPNPLNSLDRFFIGRVESISEEYLIIKNEKNIRLKISFKNFDNLIPEPQKQGKLNEYSEMFFG